MSKYTTEVRYICETKSGFTETELANKTIDEIISASRTQIFNFNYPIFDNAHKSELETKILKNYYTREICAETYGLWQLWLNSKMNLIMPKYNKLYQAENVILNKELKNIDVESSDLRTDNLLKTDNFTRTDNLSENNSNTRTDNLQQDYSSTQTNNLSETTNITRTDNLTETLSESTNDLRKFSDTPQGSVTFAQTDNNVWLTDLTDTDGTHSATKNNTGTENTSGTVTNTGTQGIVGSVDNTGTQSNVGNKTNTGTQNNAGTSADTGTQLHEVEELGYRGSKTYAELLAEYRKNVLNIDLLIVNELADLFIKLW